MMTADNDRDYHAELMRWAESDEPTVRPGTVVKRGSQGRDEVHDMLMAAANTDEERDMIRRTAGGRPTLDPDADSGPSPLWAVRAPQSLDTAMRSLARQQGRSFSAVLREAAQDYLTAHKAV